MSTIAAADFFAAFQLREACYRALLKLSRRQSLLISQNDYAELVEVLNSKQSLLDHLGQLAEEQSSLRSAWSAQRDALPTADRRRCEAVLVETENLLAMLISAERSSSDLLMSRRETTRRELQSLSAGVQTQQAYQPRFQPLVSRFDLNT